MVFSLVLLNLLWVVQVIGFDVNRTSASVCENQRSAKVMAQVCSNMAPQGGKWPAETSPSPWKIFIFEKYIRPQHIHPVTFGLVNGRETLTGYMIKARPLNESGIQFLGHFEPQWDASFVCCGGTKYPNMLVSTNVRVLKPNETVYWAAPVDFRGSFVFEMTFIVSSRKYWRNVTSKVVKLVEHCTDPKHPHMKRKLMAPLGQPSISMTEEASKTSEPDGIQDHEGSLGTNFNDE